MWDNMPQIDMTRREAAAIVATAVGTFESEEVDEVIFVVKRICKNCGDPHTHTVFGTASNGDEAISMLARAIQRIAEEGIFDV